MRVKEPRTLEVGVKPRVSGSLSKPPCLHVSSGLQATVIKFTYEASLVSLSEIYNNISKYLFGLPLQREQGILLGVAGVDVPVKELLKLTPPYKVS